MQLLMRSDRTVLAGFAGLLILMAALAIDSARQIHDVSVSASELRKGTRDRDALLDQLRNDTYRASTLVRDYLMERDPRQAEGQKTELLEIRARIAEDLDGYKASAPKAEEEAIQNLKQRTESYWNAVAPALDRNSSTTPEESALFLHTVVVPRRNEMVQFARQVSALDDRMLDAAEARIQALEAGFQRRVAAISIATLIVGAVLAGLVVRRVRHLNEESETRFREVISAREDLKRLSDRLVAVQEEERRNLSRELHDELGQAMSAMLVELGRAESLAAGTEGRRNGLAAVRRLAEDNVAKVRNMALLLRPAMLDELGLAPALHWQAREVERRTDLRVKLVADEVDDDLPECTRTCVYRVVQEALNNCVKHARAKEVQVTIRRDGGGLSISVEDDGVGFDPRRNKGLGLLGMAERVETVGGRFQIQSEPGAGTVVSTYFPLAENQCRAQEEGVI